MSDNQNSNGIFCNAITGRPELFIGNGSAQTVVTNNTTTDANLEIRSNTRYVFTQPLTRLHLTKIENSCFESEIVFTAGSNFSLSFAADGVKTIGDIMGGREPFTAGFQYIISIRYAESIAAKFN